MTTTTKERMNQALRQYWLNLYQERGNWFIRDEDGGITQFFDGMKISA
jgi:hypothetical protein